MSIPILTTKLYIPSPRPKLVRRPRLIERLNESRHRKLTLILAPAGFGKTNLLSEWLEECEHPVAWLSLNEEDSDTSRFLSYFVAALQTITPKLGAALLETLKIAEVSPIDVLLIPLLNEIMALPNDFIFVLDDYHVIHSDSIDRILQFLLDHMPPQMHLMMTARETPNLSLSRLRAHNHLTELNVSDLRFSPKETADFLNHTMDLNLSSHEITALEMRTEGWITGLQLAALSMLGQINRSDFIESFRGSHHIVLDYLIEEVLQKQAHDVQIFLLYTSILHRLSASLCEALLGDSAINAQSMLEHMEQANLLIMPLDSKGEWYRYHHLFADVLQNRLVNEYGQEFQKLHIRASQWYEEHNLASDAIYHAFAAQDFERAARIIQEAWTELNQSYDDATLARWIERLPAQLLPIRPILSAYYALALLPGKPENVESYLQDAEQCLDDMNRQMAVYSSAVSEQEYQFLPGLVAFVRAYRAATLSNTSNTIQYAQRALDLLPEDKYLWRGSAAVLLGLTQWANGNLEAAYQAISSSLSSMKMSGNTSAAVSTMYILADIRMAQGQLRQALEICQQALKQVEDYGKSIPQGTAGVHVLLSELYWERGEQEIASQHLLSGKQLGEQLTLQVARHRWYVSMARIKVA
jgi:LuxR family transcriptional regulator, maltose regulon positive regulatory protein